MGNVLCCHDPAYYELLDTKDQTTYVRARELVRQHKKRIETLKNSPLLMNDVIDRIRDHIQKDTTKGKQSMACPIDLDRDTWRAALESQRKRILATDLRITQVTSESIYYISREAASVISKIRQNVLENAKCGKNKLYFSWPYGGDGVTIWEWMAILNYQMPMIKKELAPMRVRRSSDGIWIYW
jgi:hypothetical protein